MHCAIHTYWEYAPFSCSKIPHEPQTSYFWQLQENVYSWTQTIGAGKYICIERPTIDSWLIMSNIGGTVKKQEQDLFCFC